MRMVRTHIRTRGRKPAGWADRYALLAGVVVAALVLGRSAVAALSSIAGEVEPVRASAGLTLVTLTYTGFLALARIFGPVALPAADAAWLVLSPLPRRGVLGRTSLILLVLSLVGGAALGVALLTAIGMPDHTTARLITAMVLGTAATAGAMAIAVLAQSSPPWDTWLQALIVSLVCTAVIAVVLGNGPWRHLLAAVAAAPVSLGAALATSCAATTALLLRLAWGALNRFPARALLDASTRTSIVVAASVVLEPGALTWIAEDAYWRGRIVRSRPWPAALTGRAAALAWIDWRRLARRPRRLCALFALAALPALAAAAGAGPVVATVVGGGALAAAAAGTTGARRDGEDAGLTRLFGVAPHALLAARTVLPALLGGTWLVLALAGLALVDALPGPLGWAFGPAAAPALAAGALRMARRPAVDHSMPVVNTPVGSLPTGPFLWAVTGIDIAALGCAPLLLVVSAPPSATGVYLAAQAFAGPAVLGAFLATASKAQTRSVVTSHPA
ncbi:DUF6297 family protein [Actinomadura luteofluorescens]|uniref:DUF6297 family protein n=1 Tax=Actinomadura luteofluorescens TaxID=46163 RepID=UPI00348539B6